MVDPRIQKLAQVLVHYSIGVRRGDRLIVQGGVAAEPLLKAIYLEILNAGGHAMIQPSLPGIAELLYKHGSDDQIEYVPEPMKLVYETFDASINVMSSVNTKALSGIPPEKLVLSNRAHKALFSTIMQRTADQSFRWVGTLFPTQAFAQDAEMSLDDYADFVFEACLPDWTDPIGYWRHVEADQQRIVDWLRGKHEIRVEGPDVDLTLGITGRRFINCCGTRNMPDGEIFTGPIEDSVEGHVRFSYPTVYQGRKLEGVHLWFERGRVQKASADKGEAFLLETLQTDDGAKYVGEFAIGTNKGISRATGNTLFDEKIGGSFHLAVGAGMPETGSVNQSGIHWDMVCDLKKGGRIRVDNELIYENGEFTTQF